MDTRTITPFTFGHGLLRKRTLFVSDLDGTLLDSHSRVTEQSARLINEAVAAGTLFTVATARTPATAIDLLRHVEMRIPGAVMTGAALFNFSTNAFSRIQYLAPGTPRRLLDMYRRAGVGTFIYTFAEGRLLVYHIGELTQNEKNFLAERCHTPVKRFIVPPDGESILPENLDNTLLLYGEQPLERANALYRQIVESNIPVTALCYQEDPDSDRAEIEMFGPSTSKAAAIEAVASDVAADRIVAFGDNVNDLPILRLADTAVAVGNARDEVKEIADEVILTNDEDAVARFISKYRS